MPWKQDTCYPLSFRGDETQIHFHCAWASCFPSSTSIPHVKHESGIFSSNLARKQTNTVPKCEIITLTEDCPARKKTNSIHQHNWWPARTSMDQHRGMISILVHSVFFNGVIKVTDFTSCHIAVSVSLVLTPLLNSLVIFSWSCWPWHSPWSSNRTGHQLPMFVLQIFINWLVIPLKIWGKYIWRDPIALVAKPH